jgi:hypothetical protein
MPNATTEFLLHRIGTVLGGREEWVEDEPCNAKALRDRK